LSAALTVGIGLRFGAAPARYAARADVGALLQTGSRGTASKSGLRSVVVGVQTALATALLVGAILLAQTIARLESEPLGFRAAGLTRARLASNPGRVRSGARQRQFAGEVPDGCRRLSGVGSTAMASWLPLGGPHERVLYRGGDSS
jgi:hypothetical protein